MLYTKENDKLIPIFESGLYSICPICKKKVNVNKVLDLEEDEELFHELVFTGAQVYCADCSEHLKEENPSELKTEHDRIVRLTHIINRYNRLDKTGFNEKEKKNNEIR